MNCVLLLLRVTFDSEGLKLLCHENTCFIRIMSLVEDWKIPMIPEFSDFHDNAVSVIRDSKKMEFRWGINVFCLAMKNLIQRYPNPLEIIGKTNKSCVSLLATGAAPYFFLATGTAPYFTLATCTAHY